MVFNALYSNVMENTSVKTMRTSRLKGRFYCKPKPIRSIKEVFAEMDKNHYFDILYKRYGKEC